MISELAAERLCQVEGRNGIGKTLAVRLLELATGRQPYAGATAAWQTLREHLGPMRVVITGLRDGDTLEVQFTPDCWPEKPPFVPDALGTARLNGKEIDFRAIPDVLRVVRIGGDESIIEQFRRVIRVDAARVEQQNALLAMAVERLGEACDRLLADTGEVSPERLRELEIRRDRAAERRAVAAREYERLTDLVGRHELLVHHEHMLAELQGQAPRLDEELATTEAELTALARERQELEAQRRQLLPDAERERSLMAELERLRRERERRAGAAQAAAARARDACESLNLPTDPAALRAARAQAEDTRAAILRGRALLLVPPDLLALIDRLQVPLDEVRGSGLDVETIASLGPGAITVQELRDGLARREAELAEQQQRMLLEELDVRLAVADRQIAALGAATRFLTAALRASSDLAKTETHLREAAATLDTRHDSEYRHVVEALEAREKRELELIERRATLRYRRSVLEREGSVHELMRGITELRAELAAKPDEPATLDEARVALAERRAQLQDADDEARRAAADLSEYELRLDRTVTLLAQGAGYAWLRAAVPGLLPDSRDTRGKAVIRIAQLDNATRRLQRMTDELLNRAASTFDALELLGRGETNPELNASLLPLANHYERRFGELLADQQLQAVLFDGGRFAQLNLLQWEVSWETPDGEPRRRPIEAFSSGERAFAYVLASVLQHGDAPTRNRLLVLDEFGAFIEAGRLYQLLRFLRDQVLAPGRADQVVVILPLRQTHEAGFQEGSDERSREVAERGYTMTEVPVEAMG